MCEKTRLPHEKDVNYDLTSPKKGLNIINGRKVMVK